MSTRVTIAAVAALAGLSALSARGSRSAPDGSLDDLQLLLADLRALHLHYHSAHWQAQGPNSYGDHLLFERFYSGSGGGPDVQGQIDQLAEWMVASYGGLVVDGVRLVRMTEVALSPYAGGRHGPVEVGLALERSVQDRIDKLREKLSGQRALSSGIDDLFAGIAGERQAAIYLLQQRGAPAPQGSAARRRPAPPRPPITRALAQARLLQRMPPHSDLEYTGTAGRYHRFNFWDEGEQRARTVEVTALSERPEHLTLRWD